MQVQPQPQQPVTYYAAPSPPQEQPSYGWKVAETAYDGSANLGKIVGIFGASFGILIGVLIFGISIYLLLRKSTAIITDATITKSECNDVIKETNGTKTLTRNCIIDLSYTANDGKSYTSKLTTDSKNTYITGQKVAVAYDSGNPSDVALHTISGKTIGWILLLIGILIIGGGAFSLYLTMKYKMYQAAQGVGFVTNTIMD